MISRVDQTLEKILPPIEARLETLLPTRIVHALTEFLVFGVKQAWACLFGGLLLAGILATSIWWPDTFWLARYDALVIYAIGIQLVFLVTKLERPSEALVILIFHAVGTAMEVFKTQMGSWVYPGDGILKIGQVPLFSGFMYAAVGSYIARVIRTFDIQFSNYPRRRWTAVLAVLIYLNFFTHHFGPDVRWGLFGFAGVIFLKSYAHFTVWRWQHQMPLLVGFFLVALFIWLAENIGTYSEIWFYPDQQREWKIVSFQKMGAWYLLMIISWVLVTIVHPPKLRANNPG